ncbi:hypothetical protein A0H76_1637 [Hepatospora eriocheir]|uniref:Uncharacterized protein n=1 Tax=Hepatospora eriocheir TaxID=1081669 RepID=A0A1X0QKK2_9MICR|nr:hypothetical protein A0H76_1637 [Hepatospora eriocheir]
MDYQLLSLNIKKDPKTYFNVFKEQLTRLERLLNDEPKSLSIKPLTIFILDNANRYEEIDNNYIVKLVAKSLNCVDKKSSLLMTLTKLKADKLCLLETILFHYKEINSVLLSKIKTLVNKNNLDYLIKKYNNNLTDNKEKLLRVLFYLIIKLKISTIEVETLIINSIFSDYKKLSKFASEYLLNRTDIERIEIKNKEYFCRLLYNNLKNSVCSTEDRIVKLELLMSNVYDDQYNNFIFSNLVSLFDITNKETKNNLFSKFVDLIEIEYLDQTLKIIKNKMLDGFNDTLIIFGLNLFKKIYLKLINSLIESSSEVNEIFLKYLTENLNIEGISHSYKTLLKIIKNKGEGYFDDFKEKSNKEERIEKMKEGQITYKEKYERKRNVWK